jgi:hypothetical protein
MNLCEKENNFLVTFVECEILVPDEKEQHSCILSSKLSHYERFLLRSLRTRFITNCSAEKTTNKRKYLIQFSSALQLLWKSMQKVKRKLLIEICL